LEIAMHTRTWFAIPCFAVLMGSALSAKAEPLYTMTFLPDWFNASAINNAGQMTGVMRVPGGSHAFLYTSGDVRDLGTLGGTRSFGHGISDNGMVTGDATPPSDPTSRAFIYANGAMRDLGTLPGGSGSIGVSINNFGQVTGSASTSAGKSHAILADSGGMRDLGTLSGNNSYGAGINNAGHVVGASSLDGNDERTHAFFYRDGVMTDLGDFGGAYSFALGINDRDQIIGGAVDASEVARTFIYADGVVTMLGDLGGRRTFAQDINNFGQVVGESTLINDIESRRGFLYTDGKMLNINALIDSALGWTVQTAIGINDSQQILGYACYTRELCRPVRLDPISPPPIPEPDSLAMLLAGLTVGGLWRRLQRRRSTTGMSAIA
jgi:probable HAF family extracellular repeat protein